MAAVLLDTAELEVLFEAAMSKPSVGLAALNLFKSKNVHTVLPNTSALVRPEDGAWRAALAGVQGDLA
ncbi:hypothetical protein GCM10010215_40030 [Streptomyces virginiae]|uniref:Uncharacterized protein n=1 Tax=Streptomyces virginiae TaxID=1961 RepID=A0ABQ3NZJ5_STRVG|nr:hypothetical protein [Streptomyces virginiae]MBP2343806.1 hypothetical protein [Streptomyces virginiae]GGQ10980.1 hypothetical protein GCM10010215_40030 [Streptomyces virginiae]GHI18198.1 hypothetical protein Scinn_76610 [Streptomyces virginiae]